MRRSLVLGWPPCWSSSAWTSSGRGVWMRRGSFGCRDRPTWSRSCRSPSTAATSLCLTGSKQEIMSPLGEFNEKILNFYYVLLCCSNTDVHTVASLLKLYLRELPEPVIPFAKYEDFLTCAQLLAKDEEEVRALCLLQCLCKCVCVCVSDSCQPALIRGSRSSEDKLALYLYLTTISSSTYASKSSYFFFSIIHIVTFQQSPFSLSF